MLARFSDWLQQAPVTDPVDRRNAYFMQMLFMFFAISTPLNKLYVVLYNSGYARMLGGPMLSFASMAATVDIFTDMLMTASACYGVWLIRQGHFRRAVTQFVCIMLGSALLAYTVFGYWSVIGDLVPVMAIALGGLMLGRRALWLIYLTVMVALVAGMISDSLWHNKALQSIGRGGSMLSHFVDLPSRALIYLLVVLILDRSSNALRESLRESNRHRSRLQEEIHDREEAQEALLQARKMDAVGQLASGVAHDFNNVLGIIMGFTLERHRLDEPGAERGDDARALASALQGVEMAARRGAAVSRQLLNFTRQEVTHNETFDAAKAMRELRPLLRQLLPTSIRLHIDADHGPLLIHFDRSQFELALLNLASNARDAMPDGGSLMLSARATDPANLCITVCDDGLGMTEEVRQRIFEPFYTTKPVGSGTGLGLTVIYGLVERGGGRIEVDSSPGIGSTFHIHLPLQSCAELASADLSFAGRIQVLLIENDDDLRGLLCAVLQCRGCEVSAVATGAEAEHLVSQPAFAPQVVVCDNRLADTSGLVLLPKLRRQLPQVPIIMISACSDCDGQSPSLADALVEHLPKPFLPTTLVSRVVDAARRHAIPPEPEPVGEFTPAPVRSLRHARH